MLNYGIAFRVGKWAERPIRRAPCATCSDHSHPVALLSDGGQVGCAAVPDGYVEQW